MKKHGGMMYASYKKTKKIEKYTCAKCGKELTPSTAFFYVDSCNYAITNSSKAHCRECYIKVYGRY